uniref:Protein FMC1 homolog n=1 Tax=Caenorhabditis tropicalis TaxID=1561998 RepID=A0A1I7TWT8_9PELO
MAEAARKGLSTLNTIKTIISELKKVDKTFTPASAQYKFLMEQSRADQVTTRRYSKAENESESVAKLYLAYVQGTRRLNELQEKYKGGEKTVEESARLVGLKLPERKY